ncbi:helix-turn-helix domain-containing protein [Actinokineospora enzanensis]|uniref:helix-turn-helix domain-containing protein n=1 Tax=Actinokineospora enzanensis TaxID=155975 RepID=UPI0003AA20E4|nr:PucR family transcriptional regulator [Actinokineospora enzanensis]
MDFFTEWHRRIDVNSTLAVAAYEREIPDFRRVATNPGVRAGMLDIARYLRQRTIALVPEERPFTGADLDFLAGVGWERGSKAVSLAAQRQVLQLHTALVMREVHEIARPADVDPVMSALRWLPRLGARSHVAYTTGYLHGLADALPAVDRVGMLVRALLADDPMAVDMADALAMRPSVRCVVVAVRVPRAGDSPRAEMIADLLGAHWVPVAWTAPDEVVAVVADEERAMQVAHDLGDRLDLPCAAGAARGEVGALTAAVAEAREVCRAAPVLARPPVAHFRADLFAEVAAARVAPVDAWLREVAARLAAGPDLVVTVDTFYRNDMSRLRTAAVLGVHPRTLDYRLRRVHELTDLEPTSVRGVRILSTAAARSLSGAWT